MGYRPRLTLVTPNSFLNATNHFHYRDGYEGDPFTQCILNPCLQVKNLDDVFKCVVHGLFFIFVFSTVDSKFMFSIRSYQMPDSNCRPLMSEATAVPTEPQPLPERMCKLRISLSNKVHVTEHNYVV